MAKRMKLNVKLESLGPLEGFGEKLTLCSVDMGLDHFCFPIDYWYPFGNCGLLPMSSSSKMQGILFHLMMH